MTEIAHVSQSIFRCAASKFENNEPECIPLTQPFSPNPHSQTPTHFVQIDLRHLPPDQRPAKPPPSYASMVFETIWGVVSLRGVRSLLGGVGGDGGGDEEDGDEDDNDPWAVSRTV
jgi:hypothetical protein